MTANVEGPDLDDELRNNMLGSSGPMSFVPALLKVREEMGYLPTTWEGLPTRLMCLMRETQELEEALAFHPSQGAVEEEIADVLNYMVLTIHDLWGAKFSHRWQRALRTVPSVHQSPADLTQPIRKELTDAFEGWRIGHNGDVSTALAMAFREVMLLAYVLRVDVPAAMATKLEELHTRGPTKKNPNT